MFLRSCLLQQLGAVTCTTGASCRDALWELICGARGTHYSRNARGQPPSLPQRAALLLLLRWLTDSTLLPLATHNQFRITAYTRPECATINREVPRSRAKGGIRDAPEAPLLHVNTVGEWNSKQSKHHFIMSKIYS